VRRFAQDDDSVGVLTKNILNKLTLIGLSPHRFRPWYAGANLGRPFYPF